MRRWLPWLVLPSVLLADGWLVCAVAAGGPRPGWLALAFALHVLACACFAAMLQRVLPGSRQRRRGTWAVAVVGVFLPVLGLLGTALALLVALRFPRRSEEPGCTLVEVTGSADLEAPRRVRGQLSVARLTTMLRLGRRTEERVAALLALSRLRPELAVPLLRSALRDPADEMRLLAFSRLEMLQRSLEERISRHSRELTAAATPEEAGELHGMLAESYAELAYLGLVDGVVCRHVLGRAAHHAEQACALPGRNKAAAWFSLGRIRLRQREAAAAAEAFREAVAHGAHLDTVAPYQAEAAFLSRDYSSTRTWLRSLRARQHDLLTLSRVAAFWR